MAELNERRNQKILSAEGATAASVEDVGDRRTTVFTKDAAAARPIVTLFEQDGAGAAVIGPKVAERLGVPFVQQAFSSERIAAEGSDVLRSTGAFDRFMRSVSYLATQDSDLARASTLSSENRLVEQNSQTVIESVADGGVILGRNGALILSRAVGSLHVRLTAPLERRTERVAQEMNIDAGLAAKRIAFEDELRAEISQRLYHWNPNDDEYHDLVLNTGTFTYDHVADLIVDVYRSKYPETTTA